MNQENKHVFRPFLAIFRTYLCCQIVVRGSLLLRNNCANITQPSYHCKEGKLENNIDKWFNYTFFFIKNVMIFNWPIKSDSVLNFNSSVSECLKWHWIRSWRSGFDCPTIFLNDQNWNCCRKTIFLNDQNWNCCRNDKTNTNQNRDPMNIEVSMNSQKSQCHM